MKEIRNILAAYDQIDWSKEQAALATVVNVEESSYRRIGARMLVLSSGAWIGGISGGCLEGDALRRARQAIMRGEPSTVVYDTMEDDAHQIGVGLGCNGKIDVLFDPIDPTDLDNPVEKLRTVVGTRLPLICYHDLSERAPGKMYLEGEVQAFCQDIGVTLSELEDLRSIVLDRHMSKVFEVVGRRILLELIIPRTHLVVFGDNYDIDAMLKVARELDWEVTLIGTKRKLRKSFFDLSDRVLTYDQVDQVEADQFTAMVLMTHDFDKDMQSIPTLLDKEPTYLGLLGPRKRTEKLQSELGISLLDRPNVYSPVGLDIGANTPEEIALAIVSEIMAHFRGRDGRSLRWRVGTIYPRD